MAGRDASRRHSERIKKRLSCELRADGRSYSGLVLDISQDGLFVQCRARLRPGQDVAVKLLVPGRSEAFELEAQVARAKRVPAQLRSVVGGGIGLRIPEPPAAYTAFVSSASTTYGPGTLQLDPAKA